jgi:hypothetical protein
MDRKGDLKHFDRAIVLYPTFYPFGLPLLHTGYPNRVDPSKVTL